METIKMLQRIKVTSTKHVMLGRSNYGFLFVIKHLVPIKEKYKGWTVIRKSTKLKLVENIFHVTEETFDAMMNMYLSLKCDSPVYGIKIMLEPFE